MFRIGDEVKVKVTHVDVDERMIDFQIVGMPLPKMINPNVQHVVKQFKQNTW